jgi:hypothetical protein
MTFYTIRIIHDHFLTTAGRSNHDIKKIVRKKV